MIGILLIAGAASAACASPVTQRDMNMCAAVDERRADAAINKQWAVTYGAMKRRDARDTTRGGGPGFASALLASQRAWLTFRDRQCVVQGLEVAGGSMQPMVIASCRATMTTERTKALAALDVRK